jgi:hypothetical protein
MTDLPKPSAPEAANAAESSASARVRRRPYEAPQCEKKRSIHRVTLLSGMGVMSMGALSMTG